MRRLGCAYRAMTFSKPLISTIIKGSGINLLNVNEITGFKVPVKKKN